MIERRLIGNTLWRLLPYGVSMVLSLTVGVLMARYLGPENLGSLASVLALTSLAQPLALLALDLPAMRQMQSAPASPRSVIGTVMVMRMGATLVAMALVLELARRGFAGVAEWPVVLCATSALAFMPFHSGALYFESRLKPRFSMIAQTVSAIVAAVARVIVIETKGSMTLLAGTYAIETALRGLMLTAGYLGVTTREAPKLIHRWDGAFARAAMREAAPLLTTILVATFYVRIGQAMTSALGGTHEAGLFAASSRLTSVPIALASMLAATFEPRLLQVRAAEPAKDELPGPDYLEALRSYFSWNALAGAGWMVLLMLMASPLVGVLFGPKFSGSAQVLQWQSVVTMMFFLGTALHEHLKVSRQLRFQLGCWTLALVLHAGLNYWWIPRYGALGCVWSMISAQGVAVIGPSLVSRRNRQVGLMLLSIPQLKPALRRGM